MSSPATLVSDLAQEVGADCDPGIGSSRRSTPFPDLRREILKNAIALLSVLVVFLSGGLFAQTPGSGSPAREPQPGKPIIIPTLYEEHRFVATPVTEGGTALKLFTDSAGGLFIFDDSAERLKLPITKFPPSGRDGEPSGAASLPAFKPDALIPPPLGSDSGRLFLSVRKGDDAVHLEYDGMLGQQWFAGRVWTFDYPGKRLLWRAPGDLPMHDIKNEVKLGFKTSGSGRRLANFARIPAEIDGETIDFLFDTGATNILPEEVLKQIGDGRPANRATSFLTRSTFEKWRSKHPEWRSFDNIRTLSGKAMIEVPRVTVGGFTVGPVWFTVQSDSAFHTYMAQWMDKQTEGALGGSLLHYLRVSVDWPNAVAVFEKP